MSRSSQLMRLIPWPGSEVQAGSDVVFDVHVLRKSKRKFVDLLMRLEGQYGPCRATQSIPEVIKALNQTMEDVEECWEVWRDPRVRHTLQSGFAYSRARIGAACWRRHEGRPPAAFVGYESLYTPFRYAGTTTTNQPCAWQAEGGPVTQADMDSKYYPGNIVDAFAQASNAQRPQFTPVPAHISTHAQHVPQQHPASPQSATVDYPPPSYPPPDRFKPQQRQSMMPPNVNVNTLRLPRPSRAVVAAAEVATRFLEAINKAVNICIELNEM